MSKQMSENTRNNIAGLVLFALLGAALYVALGMYLDESADYMEAHSYERVVSPEAR